MNNLRTVMLIFLRSYSRKSLTDTTGVRGKLKVTQTNDFITDLEEFDQDDIGLYETDFTEIAETYISSQRETAKSREQLKQRIVRSKYFKDKEPRFLTYTEKEQIIQLHKSNPEEWTIEKLSESFPVLPETLRKILKTNWMPVSVETILEYDSKVIENWKKFKVGQLPVSPKLRQHLLKFKHRKISLPDRETLANNFVRPKVDLPKPTSSFFSNIVKDPVKEEQETSYKLLASPRETKNNPPSESIKKIRKHKKDHEKLLFDEFLKKKLNNLDETTSEEKETLLDTYRKHVENESRELVTSNALDSITKITRDGKKGVSFIEKLSDESAVIIHERNCQSAVTTKSETEHASLDTYIKERKSLIDTNFNYTNSIKIPKNVYKKGMTYRVSDCYYDHDGEFLYRVPGLKN